MSQECQWCGDADSFGEYHFGSRALAAYWRSAKDGESLAIPCKPTAYRVDNRFYIVLANHTEILAMYRVKNDDVLRRLKRYPACIVKAVLG